MISLRTHLILDYLLVILLAISPVVFDLDHPASTALYILAVAGFILTLTTDFPNTPFRIIPFRIHRILELTIAAIMVSLGVFLSPELTSRTATIFFSFAIVITIVSIFTKTYAQHIEGSKSLL